MADETLGIIFIVEDGTCVSGANSYISLEEANQYQTNKNRTDWLALSDDEKMAALIKGTQYVDKLYKWRGQRLYETQVLSWPRCNRWREDYLRDRDGFPIKGIPRAIKDAICEAAFYGYQGTVDLFTTHNENGAVKRQKVDGAVEIEFFASDETAVDYISKYAALDSILLGLYVDPNDNKSVNCRAIWDY